MAEVIAEEVLGGIHCDHIVRIASSYAQFLCYTLCNHSTLDFLVRKENIYILF